MKINRFIISIFVFLIPTMSFGQEKEYKSREMEKYNSKYKYKPFDPLSIKEILRSANADYDLKDIADYTPFSDSLYKTPYQDSIFYIITHAKSIDSINFESIGEIDKSLILKYEKRGEIEAFIYQSSKYEDRYFGDPGIWVAYSTNDGKSWEYIYTGIVQRQPLLIKWYSEKPLINSKDELQIETCILRQISQYTHPGSAEFELVKDGLLLTLDLKSLRKDTDGDGLSDIVETKFHTNLNNKDTDGDGITDKLDLNPRFSVPRTDKTIIYESDLNGEEMHASTGLTIISSLIMPQIYYAADTTETVLIITDNPDIQSIQPKSTRVIILSEKEYKKYRGPFQKDLNELYLSPLFKVDDEVDTYIFVTRYDAMCFTYLLNKTKDGWIKEVLSMSIF